MELNHYNEICVFVYKENQVSINSYVFSKCIRIVNVYQKYKLCFNNDDFSTER